MEKLAYPLFVHSFFHLFFRAKIYDLFSSLCKIATDCKNLLSRLLNIYDGSIYSKKETAVMMTTRTRGWFTVECAHCCDHKVVVRIIKPNKKVFKLKFGVHCSAI